MAYRAGYWAALSGVCAVAALTIPAAAIEPAPLPPIGTPPTPMPPVGTPPAPLPGDRASGTGYITRTCADLHRVIAELPNDLVAIRGESLNLSEKEPDDIWRAIVTPPGFSNCVVMAMGGDWLAGYSCDDSSVAVEQVVTYETALTTIAGCLDVSWGARFTQEDQTWTYEFFHVNGPMHVYLRVNPEDGSKQLDVFTDAQRRAE